MSLTSEQAEMIARVIEDWRELAASGGELILDSEDILSLVELCESVLNANRTIN